MFRLISGTAPLLSDVEQSRLVLSRSSDRKRKAQLGQFLTPAGIARFMAEMFSPQGDGVCHLLDPGAGIGSLSAAFLERWQAGGFGFRRIEVDAFEIDPDLHPYLEQTLEAYCSHLTVIPVVRNDDFIHAAVDSLCGDLFAEPLPQYTHAILNPPYKKIRSASTYRKALRRVGIETVNLYSGFVALSLSMLEEGGQLVAIVPRSFCNGPYYRPFRKYLLDRAAILKMHLFGSRKQAFKEDQVLQENLIIHLERGGPQGSVTVTTSTDDSFADLETFTFPFDRIVHTGDLEQFIHIPTTMDTRTATASSAMHLSLKDIGIEVSTGPVVDYRLREHLRDMPEAGTVPLLYPGHFRSGKTTWPNLELNKPNGILRNLETDKWLLPNGFYCVVRRFTSKEERRRVVASVVNPATFPDCEKLGFENHLNVFHAGKQGLPENLARGLAVYLNSTCVDDDFRLFNGHTQVNATDLRRLKYPSRKDLIALGIWSIHCPEPQQEHIDQQLKSLCE